MPGAWGRHQELRGGQEVAPEDGPRTGSPRRWLMRKGRRSPSMKMLYPSLGPGPPEDLEFREWEKMVDGEAGLRLPRSDCVLC